MRVKLPRGIRAAVQIGFVLALIPVICAPFLIGGAQWINWLAYGNWPDWSPFALGWWNPAEHRTGWAALDRMFDTMAGSNVVALCVLILMAVAAYAWVAEWREKRAFEKWYNKRVLTLHRIDASPAATAARFATGNTPVGERSTRVPLRHSDDGLIQPPASATATKVSDAHRR